MTINEYQNVKDFSYEEYCGYLNKKYGAVPRKYGSSKNKRPDDGLFIHHVGEDEVASLSNRKIALANDPVYQEPENLVYCNYLEHLLLHIMIGEETAGTKNLGLNGPFVFIVPALKNYFEKGWKNEKINAGYYSAIEGNKEVYDILLKRYNKIVCDTDFVLEHNMTLYPQMENLLNTKNKALVILGTGLGKTSTALQYLWKNQCRALVIGPNNLIKSGWEKYREWCDTITYQSFANRYEKINYNKYGLVILDEAHHAGYDEASGTGAEVWARGIQYLIENNVKILGLTATPLRSDGVDICDTLFEGCVCEGRALEDAIEEGIIHPFSYVTAIYDTDQIIEEYKDCENVELVGQLNLAINNTPTMKDIFKKYMPDNKRKGIIFIQEIADKQYVLDIFKNIYPDVEYRAIDSLMDKEVVAENRKWFETTDEGYLLAINMISEGAHYKGVNTLIMFRRTNSYLLYTQQIGRIVTLAKDEDPHAIVFDLVNNIDNVEYNDRKISENRRYSTSRVLDAIRRRAEKSNQVIVADETRDIVRCIKEIKEFEDKHWTDEEIEILKKYYENEGRLIQERLPNRTWNGIMGKAHFFGLKLSIEAMLCKPWSENNVILLREKYPLYGRNITELIKYGYTPEQIAAKALRENLVYRDKMFWKVWSDEEDLFLKSIVSNTENIKRDEVVKIFQGKYQYRTESSIKARMKTLRLSKIENVKFWTEEEDEIIKTHYPEIGAECAKMLSGRTIGAIKARAKMLGVRLNRSAANVRQDENKFWTDEEIEILKKNYSVLGAKGCKDLLPNRSDASIRGKAKVLKPEKNGCIVEKATLWTEEEVEILKKYYPILGVKACKKLLPNRDVKSKAATLGLRVESYYWTEEEVEILKSNYPKIGIKGCKGLLPNKSVRSITAKAWALGVKKSGRIVKKTIPWTDEEIEILKRYYPTLGAKGCKELLPNRDVKAIQAKTSKLGLRWEMGSSWTDEEIEILKKNYPVIGANGCKELLLNRNIESVYSKAKELGLKFYNMKKVRCVEMGILYDSVKEASKKTKIAPNNIHQCVRGKTKTAGGYHWEYVEEKDKNEK